MLFLMSHFPIPHLKNSSKRTPGVPGSTQLQPGVDAAVPSWANGMEANILFPPTVLTLPVTPKSRGNHYLQSRESKNSCSPVLLSCRVHPQHLTCSCLETNTPNLSLNLYELCRALTWKAMAWVVCGLFFFKLFLFQQQVSVV